MPPSGEAVFSVVLFCSDFRAEMVRVHRRHTVIPSELTSTGKLSLSHCDQIKLPTHGSQLYVYANAFIDEDASSSSLNSSIQTLTTSLSKALFHYYPFSGRLTRIQGGRFQLLCNAKGALLFEATCETNLNDFGDFENTQFVEQLMLKIDYGSPIEEIPLLIAQLTRFKCGGLILAVALCRVMVDGASVGNFMNSWAKLARGEDLGSNLLPQLNRTLLDSRNLHTTPRFDHLEFLPAPLCEGNETSSTSATATAILKLTKDQVLNLKKKASVFGQRRPYTSFEVITGHLWRCVCKVRYSAWGNGFQQTRLTTLVNCRNRLNPPLESAYFGNATFPTVTENCFFDELVRKPLSYAVGKVREAISKMSDGYVSSALDYITNQKDLKLLRDTFYNSGGEFRRNPNLYVTSWANFPFYGTDFGWGKPVYFGPGHLNSDGKAFVVNDGNGDGFVVTVCLPTSHVDALKKLFHEEVLTNSRL